MLETIMQISLMEIQIIPPQDKVHPVALTGLPSHTMMDMAERFGVRVGLSDHTLGTDVAIAAVALGATIVEKHFILDRNIGGADAAFSMQQDEFTAMVQSLRNVEKALGTVAYKTDPTSIKGREFSRSLYVAADIKAGDIITEQNVRSVRPGFSLAPKYLPTILGKRIKCDKKIGERLSLSDIE